MRVQKRDGSFANVHLNEISDRIAKLCKDLDKKYIDPIKITMQVVQSLHDGISTSKLDAIAAQICHSNTIHHPHFNVLASRLVISDHQKNVLLLTTMKYAEVCKVMHNNKNQLGEPSPLISDELYEISQTRGAEIDKMLDHSRDFLLDYFGFQTLKKSYLLKVNGKVVETPQHMFMRVALGIWSNDFEKVKKTYDLMSTKHFTHATPTLYNAGTRRAQQFSCFLLGIDDNIESIFKSISDTAQISKWSGGIGIHVSSIRANGSYISKTGGTSDGIKPMLKVFNNTAKYINQGGRRPGSFAMYLEPWHADVEDFLRAKLPHVNENDKSPDLFYALWVPDLFMTRVRENKTWSLMCPNICQGLADVHGKEFEALYTKYESEGKFIKQIPAQELYHKIVQTQTETGTPYILFKDSCNHKSNQKNLGTIKSSNLCAEIIEYSDTKKYACCVLASVVLPTFVHNGKFQHDKLMDVVTTIVQNLNRIIDINFYPVPETRESNMSERPLGIGVQGLSDVFCKLGLPYESPEALQLDQEIHETIYYAALKESCNIAKVDGPYQTFQGSPISQGLFQFDLAKQYDKQFVGCAPEKRSKFSKGNKGTIQWGPLREDIMQYGVRNSLVTALMPTASTSSIMGSTESFEPISNNFYTKRALSGEYIIYNKYLTDELIKRNLWTDKMHDQLILSRGSIQNLDVPDDLKQVYKTVWEIPQKSLIDHSAARGIYVDQSQSLNLYFEENKDLPSVQKRIANAHFYGWNAGLKTGSYYIRSKPASQSTSFTVKDQSGCEMCSS